MRKVLNVAEKPSIGRELASVLAASNHCNVTRLPSSATYNPVVSVRCSLPFGGAAGAPAVEMVITSVRGHLKEIDYVDNLSNWNAVPPAALLAARTHMIVPTQNADIKRNLTNLSSSADELYLWLDCDREGEAIAFEVLSVCRSANPRLRVRRALFSALTPANIFRALNNLAEPNALLAAAVECRQELDFKLGTSLTRLITLRLLRRFDFGEITRVLSYGPCQFPTLGIVVARYIAIQSFIPECFFCLELKCSARPAAEGAPYLEGRRRGHNTSNADNMGSADEGNNDTAEISCSWTRGRVYNELVAMAIYQSCLMERCASIEGVRDEIKSKRKPLPMNTISLTQLGVSRLRMAAHQVMAAAELLYNKGLISYPRTETDSFDKSIDLKALVGNCTGCGGRTGAYATKLLSPRDAGGDSVAGQRRNELNFETPLAGKRHDQAHPPIHPVRGATPTEVARLVGGSASVSVHDCQKVYELVLRHFLAVCSRNMEYAETVITLRLAQEPFEATGIRVLFEGYLEIYSEYEYRLRDRMLPIDPIVLAESVRSGAQVWLPVNSLLLRTGETTPPCCISEAELVSAMDRNGIGTDATMHEHIKLIEQRQYVHRFAAGGTNRFKPTVLGLALFQGYRLSSRNELTKIEMRAEMEAAIAAVANGTATRDQVVASWLAKYTQLFHLVSSNLHTMEGALSSHFPRLAL